MKKQDKELLIDTFEQYLKQKNMALLPGSGYRSSDRLSLVPKSEDEKSLQKTTDFFKNKYLFETKLDNISFINHTYDFMAYLLENDKTKNMCFRFMVEKMPLKMEENDHEKNYLILLKPYHDLLFKYISRPAHLSYFFKQTHEYLEKHITNQEERELIIDVLIGMPLFKEIDNERIIYNLVQKYIDNKEKYNNSFPNIKATSDEHQDLDMEITEEEVMTFKFKTNTLINFHSQLSVKSANLMVRAMSKNIMPIYEKLEVNGLLVRVIKDSDSKRVYKLDNDDEVQTFELIWRGNNLNKELLRYFTNIYLKEQSIKMALTNTWHTSVDLSKINELLTKSRTHLLHEKLSVNTDNSQSRKSKI